MLRKLIRWELFLVFLLIPVNMLVGVVIVRQFGESWYEYSLWNYADQSLDAYKELFQEGYQPDYDPAQRNKRRPALPGLRRLST